MAHFETPRMSRGRRGGWNWAEEGDVGLQEREEGHREDEENDEDEEGEGDTEEEV